MGFKPHKAICVKCLSFGYVVVKAMLCQRCNEQKKREAKGNKQSVRIKPVSDKKAKKDEVYRVMRQEFLKAHPHCFAQIRGICTHEATDCHHLYWGKDREKHYLDFTNIVPICRNCHVTLHSVMSKAEAIQRGLKKEDNANGGI